VYRRFGEVDAAGVSPLYERVAVAVSASDEALRAIEAAPARKRNPAVILAALHDLALAGRAPELAEAYAAADGDAAAAAAIDTLLRMTESVVAIAVRRQVRADETGRGAVLYPAIAEVARRVGAEAVGLIDVGGSAGLNLTVDRVGITYDNARVRGDAERGGRTGGRARSGNGAYGGEPSMGGTGAEARSGDGADGGRSLGAAEGGGQVLGDPGSPARVACAVVGERAVPDRVMPGVVARVGVGLDLVDVTDPDEARWLRACVWPDQGERGARLDAELALAAAEPAVLMRGDAVEVLPEAIARVPAGALPVVTTTWALSRVPLESRLRFLRRLDEAATGRAVAWVSVEGVGVAPAIPTFGDRPASGHSIIGLAVFEHAALHAESVGRCWSRGRMLSWLADA
jgi:hypothetical protein